MITLTLISYHSQDLSFNKSFAWILHYKYVCFLSKKSLVHSCRSFHTFFTDGYGDLADLKVGRCSATIKVRILRLWEARNVKKSGEGVNMILAKVILVSKYIITFLISCRVYTFWFHRKELLWLLSVFTSSVETQKTCLKSKRDRPGLNSLTSFSLSLSRFCFLKL